MMTLTMTIKSKKSTVNKTKHTNKHRNLPWENMKISISFNFELWLRILCIHEQNQMFPTSIWTHLVFRLKCGTALKNLEQVLVNRIDLCSKIQIILTHIHIQLHNFEYIVNCLPHMNFQFLLFNLPQKPTDEFL